MTLATLLNATNALHPDDACTTLHDEIDATAEATVSLPVAVVAATVEGQQDLVEAIEAAHPDLDTVALPPLRSRLAYDEHELDALVLTRALFVLTTARSLVPAPLVHVLAHARQHGLPVAVVVDRMRGSADPVKRSLEVPGKLMKELGSTPMHVVCLGDERFAGPEVDAAVTQAWTALALDDTERRHKRLVAMRTAQVRAWVRVRSAAQSQLYQSLAAERRQVRSTREADALLARATLNHLASAGRLVGTAILELAAEALVDQAGRETANGETRDAAIERLLRSHVSACFDQATEAVLQGGESSLHALACAIDRDVAASMLDLGAVLGIEASPVEGPSSLPELEEEVRLALARARDEVVELVRLEESWLRWVSAEPVQEDDDDASTAETAEEDDAGQGSSLTALAKRATGGASPLRQRVERDLLVGEVERVIVECAAAASRSATIDKDKIHSRARDLVDLRFEAVEAFAASGRDRLRARAEALDLANRMIDGP